ncbi:hypothetical protein KP509_20G043000 [Ceratopteris richardii]|uniref:Pentatricopeptide repeat-containing protein n=1 Tax=Ceratopteris richardii TaxID=49495 RepID=A0A8T2SER2_CERRI|nr:hypothetical protein KP509_20G043000 [Ceratopteris richardii]KAH7331611.1 hypothetical protein KP509_20G043000 [Ceratopteris richardii]
MQGNHHHCWSTQYQLILGRRTDIFQEAASVLVLLKEATEQRELKKGKFLYAEAVNRGLLSTNVFLGSCFINLYAKCGALENAQEVFDELPLQNIVSWNALIAGYAKHGHYTKVLTCFNQMQRAGVLPDAMTFTCLLKACGNLRAVEKGSEVHIEIVKHGHLNTNLVLGNALIDMYAKCGALEKARMIFNELPTQNVVTWTTLIAGYCCHGEGEKALDLFKQMNHEGLPLDAVVLRCILKVCGSIAAVNEGKEVHAEIARKGFLNEDVTLGSALVDMYAKSGELVAAQEVFDELPVHNIVAWTALIAGYARDGQGERAHHCFKEMKCEGLFPNSVTLLCLLKACSNFGAADKGRMMHAEAIRQGFTGEDYIFGNALVDMYAKCGSPLNSYHVFFELHKRTVVAWTSLIAGYGQVGGHVIVFYLFNEMLREGIDPTSVTFLVLLHSCSSLGIMMEAQMYFEIMSKDYGITPSLDHYACMIHIFSQLGEFEKALSLIGKMPLLSNRLIVWSGVLFSCGKWGNLMLGNFAFDISV